MNSSFIGKIDKARKYAEERDRVSINSFHATFEGNHNTYQVSFESGEWKCECLFFHTRGCAATLWPCSECSMMFWPSARRHRKRWRPAATNTGPILGEPNLTAS